MKKLNFDWNSVVLCHLREWRRLSGTSRTSLLALFVESYTKAYGRMPTLYASQGYDTARLIASALKAVNGNLDNLDAFKAALKKADFASVRGNFSFGSNQHPVQDLYIREVIQTADGFTNKTVKKVFENHVDAYAAECTM